jgi:hypothetical protein
MPGSFYSDLTFDHDRKFSKGFLWNRPLYFKFRQNCESGDRSMLFKSSIRRDGEDMAVHNGATMKANCGKRSFKVKTLSNSGDIRVEMKMKPEWAQRNGFTMENKVVSMIQLGEKSFDKIFSTKI